MRIKEMKLHPIAIADPPLRSSYGLHAPFALRTIVELVSTDGLTGISETYGGDRPLAALEAARPLVTGMDPFQLTRALVDIDSTTGREQQVGAWLAGFLRDRGYRVSEQPIADGRFNVFAQLDAPPRIVFSTHVDCVPPSNAMPPMGAYMRNPREMKGMRLPRG